MDFTLSEEQKILQRNVRDFSTREIAPLASRIDQDEEFPWENIRKMGEMGLMGVTIDPEYGGTGGSYIDLAIVAEEIARACASTAVIYIASLSLASQCIHAFGTHEQKTRFLTPLPEGRSWPPSASPSPARAATWPR